MTISARMPKIKNCKPIKHKKIAKSSKETLNKDKWKINFLITVINPVIKPRLKITKPKPPKK